MRRKKITSCKQRSYSKKGEENEGKTGEIARETAPMKKTQGIGANFIRKDREASEQKKDHMTENKLYQLHKIITYTCIHRLM